MSMTTSKETRPKAAKGRPLLWFAVVLALIAGAVAGWYARDFTAVNACLDAGGGWIAPGVCVGAPPPASPPPAL